MQRMLAIFTCASMATTGCISNPAKHPTPNDQEISFKGDAGDYHYLRGDEELDEQDYYMLLDDKKAEDEVASYRASAVRSQGIGAVLMGIGAGIVGATLFAYIKKDQLGELPQWVTYTGVTGGAILFTGGQQLRSGGKERVLKKRVLDAERAEIAINMKRYGVATIGPGIVKKVIFGDDTGQKYCGAAGAALSPLVAKDLGDRTLDLAGHDDWFTFSAEPKSLFELGSHGATVRSPLNDSLAKLGMPITVKVAVKDNPLVKTTTLEQSLACAESLEFYGRMGSRGTEGNKGAEAKDGGNGGNGGNGGDGGEIEAEAAFVTYKGKRYLAVAAHDHDQRKFAIVDPTRGSIAVKALGGAGGTGGKGGHGGGLNLRGTSGSCREITSGNGGAGGPGGVGGRGGTLRARGPREAIEALTLSADGGEGGDGGDGGMSGSSVTPGGLGCLASSGKFGETGPKGGQGSKGKVEKATANTASLSVLREWLATNPEVRIEGEADAGDQAVARPVAKRKKKR